MEVSKPLEAGSAKISTYLESYESAEMIDTLRRYLKNIKNKIIVSYALTKGSEHSFASIQIYLCE
jgi:hypothetical protein